MKVIYVFDTLCIWCYGFSEVIGELHDEYRRRLPFEVVSGGMLRHERKGTLPEVGQYIRDGYPLVQRKTGARFGEDFLEMLEGNAPAVFDSDIPARAVAAFKMLHPAQTLAYTTEIQKAIFIDGMDPSNPLPYIDVAAEFDLEAKEFKRLFTGEESIAAAERDFKRTVDLGATGYPTVYFEFDGQPRLIARGYTDFNVLQARFDHVVSRAKAREQSMN
ncbi:MAG TPA: DsbA family protein [Cryomorphaceae bacterium]|nr:DsbA family protein [Cryomorphaceae bacterium]